MLINSTIKKIILQFNKAAGTSRGILNDKLSYIIKLNNGKITGYGEASLIKGLSYDANSNFETAINKVIAQINQQKNLDDTHLTEYPAIRFALEMAYLDMQQNQTCLLFPSDFIDNNAPIPINGLIWMDTYEHMQQQILEKIEQGFQCIKLKIGAINFEDEIALLKKIRQQYTADDMMIRVDANGAFQPGDEALTKLDILSKLNIHSIEQPIKPKQINEMASLCAATPLPIALDEELIGIFNTTLKEKLLDDIKPQYIILKPSLLGGFKATEEWIKIADKRNIGWWVTSALESNIGLNGIAQWTATLNTNTFQGLGTGTLFNNNIDSPLYIENGNLYFSKEKEWDFANLL